MQYKIVAIFHITLLYIVLIIHQFIQIPKIPGGPRKSVHFFLNGYHFCYIITTETCNTGMERKFCGLFGNIFKNCEKYFYEAVFAFFCQVTEMANKPIYWEFVNLR